MASKIPIHKIKSDASWGTEVEVFRVTFKHFLTDTTACGGMQRVFERNPTSADYIPQHYFDTVTFDDVADTALIWLEKPNANWANPTDCGDFPCTAPDNVVLHFESTVFRGTRPSIQASDFQLVSRVLQAGQAYSQCEDKMSWNAFLCLNPNLGVLLFESLDSDNFDRSI